MTDAGCIALERLLAAGYAPVGSSERVHFDGCPRCQAQALTLQAFLAPSPLPVHVGESTVTAELDRFIDKLVVQPSPTRERRIVPTPSGSWWQRWFAPGPRLALGVSMLAIVIVGAWMVQRPVPERAITRGGPMETSDANTVRTIAPTRVTDGWVLQWSSVDEATAYQVVVLRNDLQERARFDAGTSTHWTLTLESLPGGTDPAQGLAWFVEARRGADVVAKSSVGELPAH